MIASPVRVECLLHTPQGVQGTYQPGHIHQFIDLFWFLKITSRRDGTETRQSADQLLEKGQSGKMSVMVCRQALSSGIASGCPPYLTPTLC
ncbi:hypothetical protein Dda3937_02154 [Dickeya dadantii 3937]|uniref:Uncharacterized protein n=1 Tax=Dickeya dadantii (strain 3937) TaxID=198628 RepID=E0SI20_DICD3|nr:hypothetical protein Dda3937_02154 [Dickeya dadantii 3937]